MDLTKLHPNTLRELLKLSEKKAALQKELDALDARIAAIGSGAPAAAAPAKRRGRKPGRPAKTPGRKPGRPARKAAPVKAAAPKAAKPRGKRGALKDDILKLLEGAGPEGATVKDISSKLGVKNQNVHVWFSTTGKKLPEIKKVGEARYALVK